MGTSVGLFATGFPAAGDIPASNFMGQIIGIITMALTGFVPGYVISFIMKSAGWLRVPDAVQKAGIDKAELGLQAYNQ
jgi:ammonia channel protein AmtB